MIDPSPREMSVIDLVKFRADAGLTQSDLATYLGMSLRAIQDIENGRAKLRRVHEMAVERLSLRLAVVNGRYDLARTSIRQDAEIFRMLEVEKDPETTHPHAFSHLLQPLTKENEELLKFYENSPPVMKYSYVIDAYEAGIITSNEAIEQTMLDSLDQLYAKAAGGWRGSRSDRAFNVVGKKN